MPMALGLGIGLPYLGAARGPYPALDLNFMAMAVLDPRVTFSRGTLATLTNAAGNVAYSPHNLLTWSEAFDNAAWNKSLCSVSANAATSPDGLVTADKIVEGSTSAAPIVYLTPTLAVATYTMSVYAKAGDRSWLAIRFDAGTPRYSWFNLAAGVVGTAEAGHTSAISPCGNGWYRCSVTITGTAATWYPAFGPTIGDNVSIYAGDGVSGVYIWGAQLNIGPLQPYYPTTSSAYHGPRFTYDPVTHAALGLLIEEQRTNLLLNSNIIGTNLSTQSVTVAAVAHTLTFYGTGTITLSGTSTGTLVGSGAYPTRSTLTFTPTAGTLTLTVTGTVQYAQLEAGAFATSYIPTTSATVTRAADSATMTGSNFSSWFNTSAGTFIFDAKQNGSIAATRQLLVGITPNKSMIYANSNADAWITYDGANALFYSGTPGFVTKFKIALSIAQGTITGALNGAISSATHNGSLLTVTGLSIGGLDWAAFDGTISRIRYYNTALTNAQLQALTT